MRTHPPLSPSLHEAPARALVTSLARVHRTVLLVDAQERVVWISDELAELVGSDSDTVVGQPARDLIQAGGREAEIDARLRADGCLVNERVSLVSGVGQLPVELSVVQVPDREDDPGHALLIVRPVCEAEPAGPAADSDYLRAVLDSSSDAVIAMDEQGFVTFVNSAFERLLDRKASRVVGAPVALAFARGGSLQNLADALRPAPGGCGADLEFTRPDGSDLLLSFTSRPLVLPDGSTAGNVAFFRDVSEQRRFQEELALKNRELEHYVHTVSHDLRTPLVSLLGFSRLLAQDYGDVLTETGRHFLERIGQASRTMEALINDLLELSRIGASPAQHDVVDPLPVLKQLGNELKPRLDEAGIALQLPEAPPVVKGVRTQLYQVFSNLMVNAVDHMGEVENGAIRVTVENGGDDVVLGVHDNGVGIDASEHERVFEIFHTVGRPADGRRGTGIGLAIVKKIAESHGGRVWVESDPGDGAHFYVSMPSA